MSEHAETDRLVMLKPGIRTFLSKSRWPLWSLITGLLIGAWIGGGYDRYGEADGIGGCLRGAGRTMTKSFHYAAATVRDCLTMDRSSVRRLGLTQQIETRLWQDKRLEAGEIVVEVQDQGTAILKGIVPDEAHKDKAVSLARDTRGVEKVVDELAVRPSARTITTPPVPSVPTGVATAGRSLQ
jgi:hypothetical protein